MQAEKTVVTNLDNNHSAQKILWKIELTAEEIAYLEFYHLHTHGKSLKFDLSGSILDFFRTEKLLAQGQRHNSLANLSLKKIQIESVKNYYQLLENNDITDLRQLPPVIKVILCIHNQDWLQRIAQEFITTQNLLLHGMTPKYSKETRNYSKSDNIVSYQSSSKLIGFTNNFGQSVQEKMAEIFFEESYEYLKSETYVERKDTKIVISALSEKALMLFPQQTFPILTTAAIEQKIDIRTDLGIPQTQNTFINTCFSQCARVTVNGTPFQFSTIDLKESKKKLFLLCQLLVEQFLDENNVTVAEQVETAKQQYHQQFQDDYEQTLKEFLQKNLADKTWQNLILDQFNPQLPTTLKDDFFHDATSYNTYVSSYDIKLEKNQLVIKEIATFFQTNSDNSKYISKDHGPLFSIELTRTFTRGWFKLYESAQTISLVMHQKLENILNAQDQSLPTSLNQIFPSMSLNRSSQKITGTYEAICCAFRCCLPKYQPAPDDNDISLEPTESDDETLTPKPDNTTENSEESQSNGAYKNEEKESLVQNVTIGVTPTSQ